MSQSPTTATAQPDNVHRYQRAWQAFNRLISEGRSFSGYERNCCFLNLGDGQFADVSSLSNLDYLDDGRAVAVVDWDFDGRLDLWVTNRTAPRIRYLHNNSGSNSGFLSVRLEGVTCNRDAIGARVELYLDDPPDHALVRQLSAGDGYLAQSTKWIHFGIAGDRQIDRLVVRWPGSPPETFRGLRLNRHYQLVQGSAVAKQWKPPHASPPQRRTAVVTPPNDPLLRTVIVGKVAVPDAEYQDWEATSVPLDRNGQGPLLVNLWSATCPPCLAELATWTQQRDAIRAAGLDIVAISVDPLLDGPTPSTRPRQTLDRIGFPWRSGTARPELVQTLELMHDQFLQLKRELPLPTSFLLDRQGQLAVIYKGPVPVELLLADVARLDADPKVRRASALPFQGRWASPVFKSNPAPIVKGLDQLGRTADARRYVLRCLEKASNLRDATRTDLYAVHGELLLKDGMTTEALAAFSRALQIGNNHPTLQRRIGEAYMARNMPREAVRYLSAAVAAYPGDAKLLYNVGIAELALRKLPSAVRHLRQSHELVPTDASTCFQLANALHATGQTRDALPLYRQALQQRPGWPFAANNLAWILATHPDASLRDGQEAVRLAEALCRATGDSDPSSLATLAAAYAEVGRFDEASQTHRRAIELAEKRGLTSLSSRLRHRASTFAQRRPVRE